MSFHEVTIGPCRLILGDCLSVLPTLAPGSVDAVVTDPPYFQPAAHYCGTRDEGTPTKTLADMSILEHFFRSFVREASKVIKPSGTYYVFCDGQSYGLSFTALYPHCKYVRPLIWDKLVSYNGYTWRHQHELIAWGEGREATRIPTGDGDILRYRAIAVDDRIHPAEKPQDLLQSLLGKTDESGVVLDCFCGSASTGVACINTDRRFIGIELEPKYFDIACNRIQRAWDLKCSELPFEKPEPARQLELV